MNKLKIITDYQAVAEQAATAERVGNFSQASVLWHDAWLLASSSVNREWCEARSLLCSHLLSRESDKYQPYVAKKRKISL